MMSGRKEVSEMESEDLLGVSRPSSRKGYGHMGISHLLFVFSLLLNIFVIGLGLIFRFCNKQTIPQSYEQGFASDLGMKFSLIWHCYTLF